jgi:hypothetical protein
MGSLDQEDRVLEEPGQGAHNPSQQQLGTGKVSSQTIGEAEIERIAFQASPEKKFARLHLNG